jgi:AraC-like DNA-binding protein
MDGPAPHIEVHRHASVEAAWELVSGRPDPSLAAYVDGSYHGWTERASAVLRRREVAKVVVPMIINFGPRFGVLSPGNTSREMERFDTFVAGLHDCAAITEAALTSFCVQVNLTPLGAFRLLGVPMTALANRVVELDAVIGPRFRCLTEQLHDAPSWAVRFTLLDGFLLHRLAAGPEVDPRVARAMQYLAASGGRASIGAVADRLDLSRKRLITLFREQVGLGPKTVAEMMRFDRVVRRLSGADEGGLAAVAQDGGYYDQPHFNREFLRFAGLTPTAFMRARLPGGGLREP